MAPNSVERRRSNVARRLSRLLNSEPVWRFSRFMAGRIIDEVGPDRNQQIEAVHWRALSRPPTGAGAHRETRQHAGELASA